MDLNPPINWMTGHGSPDWDDIANLQLQNNTGGYLRMASIFNNCFWSEGVITNVDIVQDNNYTLSYFRRRGDLNVNEPLQNLFIRLLNQTTSPNIPGPLGYHCLPNIPADNQLISHEVNIINQVWEQVTICFTADNNYDRLWLYPLMTQSGTFGNNATIYIDRIVLIEDSYNAGLDIQTSCGDVTIGIDACEADNPSFSWINQFDNSVVGSTEQTLVNVAQNTTFEVTRSYPNNPNTVVIPVATNNCTITDDVLVTVTPLSFTFTSVNSLCSTPCSGSATVSNIQDGIAPFYYLWDTNTGNQVTQTATNLCTNVYSVTVTDANGCTASDIITINLDIETSNWPYQPQLGTQREQATAITSDNEGNVIAGGIFNGSITFGSTTFSAYSNDDSEDIYIAKFNNCGVVLWTKQIGSSSNDWVYDIVADNSGNIYIIGKFRNNINFPNCQTSYCNLSSVGGSDAFIIKLDADGNNVWSRNIGGSGLELGSGIDVDNSGNVYVTGNFSSSSITVFNPAGSNTTLSSGNGSSFIVKYNPSGDVVWAKNAQSTVEKINCYSATNELFVVGRNNNYAFVSKYNTNGTFINSVSNTSSSSSYTDVKTFDATTPYLYICGWTALGPYVARYNFDLTQNWENQGSGSGLALAYGIDVDDYGNAYTTGFFSDNLCFNGNCYTYSGIYDNYVAKFEPSLGNFQWLTKSGSIYNERASDITVHNNIAYNTGSFSNSCILGNTTLNEYAGGQDVFIARVMEVGGVGQYKNQLINSENKYFDNKLDNSNFKFSIYPNPSSGILNIVCNETIKNINIYDAIGQKVFELNDFNATNLEINLNSFSKSIYLLNFESINGNTIYEKIIIK